MININSHSIPFLFLVWVVISSSFLLPKSLSSHSHSYSHSHTLHVASLLPHSLCAPASDSHSGFNETPSTLQILHRHGPCHSLTAEATAPSLTEILTHDQSRVDSIQARLAPVTTINSVNQSNNNNKFKDKKADLPVQPGRSLGSGNYIVRVGLGTPAKTFSLVFDTGSDLTWTQCQPCSRSCYTQQDPIFNPSSSSSYSNLSCSSAQCSQLTSATGNSPGCSTATSTCIYGIQYGDQSFSVGFLSKETITLTKSDLFPNFVFGCGQNNQGLFGNTAGLLGLGRNSLSIVSQTAAKYGRYFSYCLPRSSSSTGHLSFGKSRASTKVKFTPFATSKGSSGGSFYFVDITGIRVGGRPVPINKSVFQAAGGTIIDSGTVITRLPPAAYSALSVAFQQVMKRYPTAPAYSILDTCYDFSNYSTITIPAISFTFVGNVVVNLDSTGILIAVSTTKACLAFVGNSDSNSIGIFGNTQQKTLEVVYDVAGGRLGFGSGGCK